MKVADIIPESSYSLYLKGELVAVSDSAGDIVINEEITEMELNAVDQFVELLNNDNPLVFEVPKELLNTVISSLPESPIFYHDWRAQ